jgi:hypothetical protein
MPALALWRRSMLLIIDTENGQLVKNLYYTH